MKLCYITCFFCKAMEFTSLLSNTITLECILLLPTAIQVFV